MPRAEAKRTSWRRGNAAHVSPSARHRRVGWCIGESRNVTKPNNFGDNDKRIVSLMREIYGTCGVSCGIPEHAMAVNGHAETSDAALRASHCDAEALMRRPRDDARAAASACGDRPSTPARASAINNEAASISSILSQPSSACLRASVSMGSICEKA